MMRRKPLSAALGGLALCALATAAAAQPYDTPPAPSAPREPRIAPPAEGRLPNGLRVVVAERHGVPLVTARLVVLSGAEVDPPRRAGLASVTAGLLTRGTRRHSAPALAAAAEALGGSLESGAGWNASQVGITVTTPKLPAALALVSEVAMRPTFAPAEIERYRTQALDEMKVAYAEPGTLAGLAAQRAVFGDGSYGHPVGGTPASLPRITRTDIASLHAGLYRPDNAVLVLAGDVDLPAALRLAQRHFGSWRAPHTPLPKAAPPAAQPWPEGIVVIDMPGAGQAGVSVALPSIASAAPDRVAGFVANAVLGTGYSSRLNQEIRIKRGLSYGARSVLDARRGAGVLRVSVQTKNPSAPEVVGLIHAELDRLMNTPVPADELAARKANLIGGFSRSLETTSGLADQVEALQVAGLPASDLVQRIPQLEEVSISDVQAFAMKRFGTAARRAVVAGVAGEFEAGLRPMAPKIVVVPQDKLDLEAGAPQ
jgi:zinc protease